MSGFIVMFSLIKKYQRGAEDLLLHRAAGNNAPKQSIAMHQRRISFYDEQMPM